jgi:hypothetical protein
VHEGDFDEVLPSLGATYDLAFFDGYEPPGGLLTALSAHLRPNGALVTTNLDLDGGRFRSILASAPNWNTHFVEDIAISVLCQDGVCRKAAPYSPATKRFGNLRVPSTIEGQES